MKIGVFDSGMGGLTVLHRAARMLPYADFLYYADEKNVPYGEKTREEIIAFADEAVRYMVEKGVDAVVIACNTATSCAIRFLREKYGIPFVGMEPAVKLAVEKYSVPGKRVLVTATPLTVREEKLARLIEKVDKEHIADTLALPGLVRFAERNEFCSAQVEEYLRLCLYGYNTSSYSAVVLGCTHFNYFKDTFRKLLAPETAIVDGSEGTVRRLMSLMSLDEKGAADEENPHIEYCFSGVPCDSLELERINRMLERLEEMEKIV